MPSRRTLPRRCTPVALAALLAACQTDAPAGDAGPPGDACPAGASLALGSGIDAFEAVEPGADLVITQGFQGGYHIWGSLYATGIDRVDAEMRFEMFQGDTRIGGGQYSDTFVAAGDGFEYAGATVVLAHTEHPPEEVAGKPTRMTAEVHDRRKCALRAEMTFTPRCCDLLGD